jgi:hypothetical protein
MICSAIGAGAHRLERCYERLAVELAFLVCQVTVRIGRFIPQAGGAYDLDFRGVVYKRLELKCVHGT